jgi:tRNA(Ile2) C34 agmatinyltransferase TiaS
MRIYVGFDDTDNITADRGTGKLARWFEDELPEGCRMEGVVRQQLLVDERIPYTSHNSSACAIIDAPDASWVKMLTDRAVEHLKRHSLEGSDPGLCIACGGNGSLASLIAFGRTCASRVVTQKDALEAASKSHLSGHGGTNDGIIGAAAAVGLTASGWNGRFIEYGKLRKFPDPIRVLELERSNIVVVSNDRDARVPAPGDIVHTKGWLRPRLWGNRAVLLVAPKEDGIWESVGQKRNKGKEAAATYPAS